MNAYTVKVVRGTHDAREFDLAIYSAIAASSAAARANVLELERGTQVAGDPPVRCSFVDPAAEERAVPLRRERIDATALAELESRPDTYAVSV